MSVGKSWTNAQWFVQVRTCLVANETCKRVELPPAFDWYRSFMRCIKDCCASRSIYDIPIHGSMKRRCKSTAQVKHLLVSSNWPCHPKSGAWFFIIRQRHHNFILDFLTTFQKQDDAFEQKLGTFQHHSLRPMRPLKRLFDGRAIESDCPFPKLTKCRVTWKTPVYHHPPPLNLPSAVSLRNHENKETCK